MIAVKNRQGFMLMQVLVGVALMAILGLGLASMIANMMKENQGIQSKSSEITLGQALAQQVSTSALCYPSLVDKENFVPNAVRPLKILLNTSDPLSSVEAGKTLTNWGLQINSFNLTNVTTAISSFNGSTIYVGDMELQADASSGKKMSYKNKTIGKLFLQVKDSTKHIESCYTGESSDGLAANVCRSLGGTFNTTTQMCNLDALKNSLLSSAGSCNGNQSLKGFNADGSLKCSGGGPGGCSTNSQTSNCCPGNSGTCFKSGESTVHHGSGGMGGYDTTVPIYTCICSS